MSEVEIYVLIGIPVLAFFYAAVGHGGASGYLALMALFAFDPQIMRSSALLLNLFVAGTSFALYYKGGYFKWKLFLPFAVASVPMAFLGAKLPLDPFLYKKILGVCLVFATLRIIGVFGKDPDEIKNLPLSVALVVGAILGFVSGMIGIGGGIILSPLILLFHWANMKETAAVSALFIFVNSVSGLLGLWSSGVEFYPKIYLWVAVAFAGGLAGSYVGSEKLSQYKLRYLLAAVLIFASIKLLLT